MDKKKRIIITVIAAIVFLSIIFMMFNIGNNTEPENAPVQVTLPDATVKEIPRAKIKAYEQGNKVATYEQYIANLATDSINQEEVQVQEAIAEHQAATASLARKLSSQSSTPAQQHNDATYHATSSVSTPNRRDNWKERYDYLYEKIYGEVQQQAAEGQQEDTPETIHAENTPPVNNDGFITITVGTQEQGLSNTLRVATTNEQKIKSGDKVQLRLLSDAFLQENKITRNTYIYAIAKIENNRLQLTVSSINHPSGAIPCNLVAYDTDGYKGLAFTSDDASQEISREVKNALQTTVGQLAAVTSRTAGNIIRSTSRIGSNAIGNKQQTITLPANYMMQLK